MFTCCENVYRRYLDENGKLILKEYWKLIIEIRRIKKGICNIPELTLCRCDCHK